MGCIYVITNKTTNKQYVGQTNNSVEKRYKQHLNEAKTCVKGSRILNSALKKYGSDDFDLQVIEDNVFDQDILNNLERMYIEKLNTLCPHGYNIQIGGQSKGRIHCQESRDLMRQKKLGENNHNYGKPRSDETKKNISVAKSGEKHHFYGETFTHEHKIKLSKSHKKYDSNLPMYIGYIKPRKEYSSCEGYVVLYPKTKKRYFTSNKLKMEEKLQLAKDHLDLCIKQNV